MAYTPGLPEIQTILAALKYHGEVVAVGPHSAIPQYPNPIRGDRYYDTDNNQFIECRHDRKWQDGFYTTPTTGAVYSLRETGKMFILTPSQGWKPYEEFLAALGQQLGGGGGGGVTIYETPADLRVVPTINQGIEAGTLVVIGAIELQSPGATFNIPINVQWGPDVPIGMFPMEHTEEVRAQYELRGLIIPDDVWALLPNPAVTGCWINPATVLSNQDDEYTELDCPMPLNNPPEPGPDMPESFLTGPDYFWPEKALTVAQWDGGANEWSYNAPDPAQQFYGRFRNGTRMFAWSYGPDPAGWQYTTNDSNTSLPFYPILDGIANSPEELLIQTPNFGDVYIVGNNPDPQGAWAGHARQFVWLDGGANPAWVFGGDAFMGGPWIGDGTLVLVNELSHRIYWCLHASNEWKKMTADSDVTTNSPATGGPVTVTLTGTIKANWLNRRQESGVVVFEFITETNPFSWLVAVQNPSTGIGGGMYRGRTNGSGDFTIEFSNAMTMDKFGTKTGWILVDGRLYPVSVTINP